VRGSSQHMHNLLWAQCGPLVQLVEQARPSLIRGTELCNTHNSLIRILVDHTGHA
jgi:hypothetical protein